jgi:filamentous hemagglutinin family protein
MMTCDEQVSFFRQQASGILCCLFACFMLATTPGLAQTSIRIDPSWGRAARTVTPSTTATTLFSPTSGLSYDIPGGVYTIPQCEGRVEGLNLFHSFEKFSVGQGDAALFTTQDLALQNVIARVSGSSATTVNGLLMLQAPDGSKPNFFLVNPAGIAFGAGAQIDVPAAFHVSTANNLNFADGTSFNAGKGPDSTLTIAAPESFGFVGGSAAAPIKFKALHPRDVSTEDPDITFNPRNDVNIVAGTVEFDSANLSVPDGNLRVIATGSRTVDVPLTGESGAPLNGSIQATNSEFSTTGGGSVLFESGKTTLLASAIVSNNAAGLPAGPVTLIASDVMFDEGRIASFASGSGAAAGVSVRAHSIAIDGKGVFAGIDSESIGTGSSGAINVNLTGDISIRNAGEIASRNLASGAAGGIYVQARSLTIDGQGIFAGLRLNKGPASIKINVTERLWVKDGGRIASTTLDSADAGPIDINAGSILIGGEGVLASILSRSTGGATGNGGALRINSRGDVTILGQGEVSADTRGIGSAGEIDITARSITIDGQGTSAEISSRTEGDDRAGPGGRIRIDVAENLSVRNGGLVTARTLGVGRGGAIDIHIKSLTIDGQQAIDTDAPTGIDSGTLGDGHAGEITIRADDAVSVSDAGQILSSTSGRGAAGAIKIEANSLAVRGGLIFDTGIFSEASLGSSGPAGSLSIIARENIALTDSAALSIENNAIVTEVSSLHPTTLSLLSPRITLANGARITAEAAGNVPASKLLISSLTPSGAVAISGDGSAEMTSSTRVPTQTELERLHLEPRSEYGTAQAGDVEIRAGNLTLSGANIASQAKVGATGAAGRVSIAVDETLSILGNTRVTTDTLAAGSAGNVSITAGNLLIDQSEVSSAALLGSTGNGGGVEMVLAHQVTLMNGGVISTSTEGGGSAGSIKIEAGDVAILGSPTSIRATAGRDSSGQTGDISVMAGGSVTLRERALLSIQNDASRTEFARPGLAAGTDGLRAILPSTLSVSAPRISVNGAQISASSTGNIAASNLRLDASERLAMRNASLTTTARNSDGGGIDIRAGQILTVDHSQVTTSVLGIDSGNGGDVRLQADTLLMNAGLIQANTVAPLATGGNINIDVGSLVSTGALLLGGDQPFAFDSNLIGINVIQAASPNGVSGNVRVSGPIVDAAGNLRGLSSALLGNPSLPRDLCRYNVGSAFTPMGRGGIRLASTTWVRSEDSATASSEQPSLRGLRGTSSVECH